MDFGGNVAAGGAGWKKTYTVQAQFRADSLRRCCALPLRPTAAWERWCATLAIPRTPASLRNLRHLRPGRSRSAPIPARDRGERALVQAISDDLRPVAYKAAGTLQRISAWWVASAATDFDALLGAMAQAGLIATEDAEYEKDGEVRRYRKVMLTEAGRALRPASPLELLIGDGLVEEFGGRVEPTRPRKKAKAAALPATGKPSAAGSAKPAAPVRLTAPDEALAARIRQWRAEEAKRLRVPAYVVLHDRTLTALALARPRNPRQLLEVDGMGPAKVERFGAAILSLCAAE